MEENIKVETETNKVIEETTGKNELFSDVLLTLSNFKKQITQLQTSIKDIEKQITKERKQFAKTNEKKNKGNKKPSGFATPSKISDELCSFMGVEKGSQAARTEVTQYVIQYIKDNHLVKQYNKKIIDPDDKLKKLLDPKENDEVTYFNIQKLMNKHFISKKALSENN